MRVVGLILLAVVSSVVTTLLMRADSSRPKSSRARPSDVQGEIDALRREHAALRARVDELRARHGVTPAEFERVLARLLRERAPAPQEPAPASVPDLRAAMALLMDANRSATEKRAAWDALIEKGHIDAVVAEFERRAAAYPGDTSAHFQLGIAYHQKMRAAGGGAEAGKWGQKGSEAYAKAIELDEENWEARFAQAQHFYWAEMKGDSLRHLKILRKQQAGRAPEKRHAGAFLFLGNLHLELGNKKQAREVWTEGLRYFPDNERMRALLEALKDS